MEYTLPSPLLLPSLQSDIVEAEKLRIENQYTQINTLYSKWFGTGSKDTRGMIIQALTHEKHSYFDDWELLAVGLLGLIRIVLDSTSTAAKMSVISHEEVRERLSDIKSHIEELDVGHRVPWTIHGAINWDAELYADQGKIAKVIGGNAEQLFLTGIVQTEATLRNNQFALQMPYINRQDMSKGQKDVFIAQRRAVGSLFALGVLYGRLGRVNGKINDLLEGARSILLANTYELNPNRCETIGSWLMEASINPKIKSRIDRRMYACLLGVHLGGWKPIEKKARAKIRRNKGR